TYDIVTAGQCWHWFDRPRAAAEVKRILKPSGMVAIVHFDWVPLAGNMVRSTEDSIESHNSDCRTGGGLGMYPQWLRDLGEAGFQKLETFSYDVDVPYTPEAWRGRIRASAGVGGMMSSKEVKQFDVKLAELLAQYFPDKVLQVPHRVFALIASAS
ncbi:MAG: methyltransferase domain-containing protein, partial [Gammaproteobacteria bacterium]|nr:methyltransferase domain-containing protein [Gammaproteobacteria bacterium]